MMVLFRRAQSGLRLKHSHGQSVVAVPFLKFHTWSNSHLFILLLFLLSFVNYSVDARNVMNIREVVGRHLLSRQTTTGEELDSKGSNSATDEEASTGLQVLSTAADVAAVAAAAATTTTTTSSSSSSGGTRGRIRTGGGGAASGGGIWPRNHFEGVNYLIRYGYLHPDYGWFLSNTDANIEIRTSLQRFQRIAGITVTGVFDAATFSKMRQKRCGVTDKTVAQILGLGKGVSPRRKRRFALMGPKWNHRDITYKVSEFPQNLSRHDVDSTINAAFKVWSNITYLQFTWKPRGPVDINIRFLSGNHGDGRPFDGINGILAHAFFPNNNDDDFDGDIHFDADENWALGNTADSRSGQTSLLCQSIHQIGHSLGLFHSESSAAQMWPYIMECNGTSVHADDVQALRTKYSSTETGLQLSPSNNNNNLTSPAGGGGGGGGREDGYDGDHSGSQGSSSSPSPGAGNSRLTTNPGERFWWSNNNNNNRNNNGQIDRQTYPYWYRFSRPPGAAQSATTLSSLLSAVQPTSVQTTARPKYCDGRLDAITVATDHLTYGFRDDLVFRFNQINVDYTYPKKIQEVFPRGPLSVDAAVTFSKSRKKAALGSTYLIKGNLVWRYRHTEEGFQLEHFYPKPWAKEWDVTGNKIESAFKLGRKIYLLIDNRIWLLKGKKSRQRKYHEKKRIKLFQRLPDFQAAVQWINRNTYFFTGSEYYRADLPAQRRRYVLNGPRDTAYWWFGCNEIPHIRQPFEDKDDNGWDLELTK
ncbi:collagenase 3-like [Argonauta hians]